MTSLWGTNGLKFWARINDNAGHGRRVLLTTIGVLLMASASAAAAHPVTIGANLKQAPNVNFDCSVIPFEFSPFGTGGPSCAWGTPSIPGSSTGGLDVPGTGTISQVKLRVGASTGRMQIVILRTLFDPNDPVNNQCCVMVARSSIFTPVRNGITTLKVTLPVREGALGSVDVLDQVGLQILEDHVTIPVINETSLPIQDQPIVNYNEPAFTKLGASQLAADPAGYRLDMQAIWNP